MSNKNTVNMCEGPILKKILAFAFPVFLTSICQALFHTADLVVVGKFGSDISLNAIGATGPITTLIIGVFNGLALGAGVCVSNYFGAKDEKSLSQCVHTSMTLSVFVGLTVMLLGICLAKPMILLLKTPELLQPKAVLYLRLYFVSSLFSIIYNFSAAILRAVGNSKRSFYYIVSGGVINVILNLVFVIGLGKDVMGVALATVISSAVSTVLTVRYLMKFDGSIRLYPKKLKIDMFQLKLIAKTGIPTGIQSSCYSISSILVQAAVNVLGVVAVGGNTAATNLGDYVYFAMASISSAGATFTAQNYGAGNFERIKKCAFMSSAMIFAVGVVLGTAFFMFSDFFLGIYTDSASEIAFGRKRIMYFTLPYFLFGIVEYIGAMLKGMRRAFIVMVVSLSGICGIRVLWILTVFEKYKTADALYSSYTVSWIITLTVFLVIFVYVFKQERNSHNRI